MAQASSFSSTVRTELILQRCMAATIFSGRFVHSRSDGEARIMAYRSLRDTSAAVVMPLRFIARNWGLGHDTAMTHGPHGTLAFGSMELRVLNVLQWRGAHAATAAAPEADCGQDLFQIDTCQRRVAVMFGSEKLDTARRQFPADGALEHFEGAGAYAFLLRFCCGLESKLVAESEIFGQIKQAWRDFSGRGSPLAKQLSPWIQPLFQDAKEIRAQYLGSLGDTLNLRLNVPPSFRDPKSVVVVALPP